MSDSIASVASTIVPSKIPDFIQKTRSISLEMEEMIGVTPVEGQSMGAAKILFKYGCV